MPPPLSRARTSAIWTFAKAALLLTAFSRAAFADDPVSTSMAAIEPPDKWQYTLFNPAPPDALRSMDIDRPNKTNTSHTIDAGHLQIETGVFDYTYDRDRYHGANGRIETLNLRQLNFRLGVLNDLELNAVANVVDSQRDTDYMVNQSVRQSGLGDTFIGGKLNLWGNDGADGTWATALAIQPQIKIPTARENLGNGHAELFVGVPFLMNLPAQFNLSLQTTVSWERSTTNKADVTGWQNSASIDRVFFGKLDVYFEYWSHVTTERHQEAQQTLDVGVTYAVTGNLILDTGINFGLNKASNTIEWVAGVSAALLNFGTEQAMYDSILVTLDATPTDRAIIEHVKALARTMHSRLVLLHVADGWAARTYGPDAISAEVDEDLAYLSQVRAEFEAEQIPVEAELAFGDPATEIVRWVRERGCDLVAMSTHGHRFLADLVLGTTASRVQHKISVPVLLLRAK